MKPVIKLTFMDTPVWLMVGKIISFTHDGNCSNILMDNDKVYQVSETPKQIIELIEKE